MVTCVIFSSDKHRHSVEVGMGNTGWKGEGRRSGNMTTKGKDGVGVGNINWGKN